MLSRTKGGVNRDSMTCPTALSRRRFGDDARPYGLGVQRLSVLAQEQQVRVVGRIARSGCLPLNILGEFFLLFFLALLLFLPFLETLWSATPHKKLLLKDIDLAPPHAGRKLVHPASPRPRRSPRASNTSVDSRGWKKVSGPGSLNSF
jgi:hypothetical protein